jgi:2-methylfumaryl-CoA hydratase
MATGRHFEDFTVGQRLQHPLPRTIHGGDLSLYIALTGDRSPLSSSTEFARSLGFAREVVPDLLVFHLVFGQTVVDVSYRAIANLGYADVKFLRPVYPGDTLSSETEIIGKKQTSNGEAGVVYVRTVGSNQKGQEVVAFVRWVMVPKKITGAAGMTDVGNDVTPVLPAAVPVEELPIPQAMNLQRFTDLTWVTGSTARWGDYQVGQRMDHTGAMTIEDADHMQATRLYHNSAQVHFDGLGMAQSRFGKRLVYGGHIISVAHALAQADVGNALMMAAWNSGVHSAPTTAGDTIRATTHVVETASVSSRADVGAVRLVLVAAKNLSHEQMAALAAPGGAGGRDPHVVLELDYWALVPR